MSRPAEEILELDRLRAIVRGYTTFAPGRRVVESLAPGRDRAALDAVFPRIAEAVQYLRAGHELGFGAVPDPEPWLARLEAPAGVLVPADLLDAASLIEIAAGLKPALKDDAAKFPLLAAAVGSLADLRDASRAIRRAVLPNGEISDDASPELRRIRAAMGKTRDKIQQTLRAILRSRESGDEADYVTLRNDRFVIPVRAADRRAVPGVVHGASGTGQTLFVEPLATIELNNKLVELAEEEAAEIARILEELTERLRGVLGPLRHMAATLADLDSVLARARFAREFNCTMPHFCDVAALRLDAARHPVLEARLRGEARTVVPMSLALGGSGSDDRVLVISGPNTGGKTVALKTVGLAVLAAQSGIPVAADRAELPLVDQVLADIGDEQSIAADLSTFSAHALNLRAMLEVATERSLVLVDEMGTGTAPEEGAALAVALLEEFRARRCLTLATTHHDRLKTYASTTPGVLNAAVEFDDVNLRPTYRLMVGVPGTSSGIAIAERLGLPPRVVERARAELTPEAREAGELIAWLHRSRDELEEIKRAAREELARLEAERAELRTEWAERQRQRLAELEKQFAAVIKQYEKEIAALIGDIKDRELRAKLEKQAPRRAARAAADAKEEANAAALEHLSASQQELGAAVELPPQAVPPEELRPGMRIRVRGLAKPVVLRRKDERGAEVEAGPLRMKIALEDIVGVEVDGAPAANRVPSPATKRGVTVHAPSGEEEAPEEVNVIGCTVEEATERLDKLLDTAVMAGKSRLRVIHGHGTGALRRGLAAFFSEHPHVSRHFHEKPEHGGDAVTIVELKG